jgi:hypothetical protein
MAENNQSESKNEAMGGYTASELDEMDKLLAIEDEKNSKYRKRMLYLIPFNFFALWGTIKYFQNVQRIAKKYWPKK